MYNPYLNPYVNPYVNPYLLVKAAEEKLNPFAVGVGKTMHDIAGLAQAMGPGGVGALLGALGGTGYGAATGRDRKEKIRNALIGLVLGTGLGYGAGLLGKNIFTTGQKWYEAGSKW